MTKEQKIQFKELEQYFLTRYRQTGNIKPLRREVHEIVKEMCPSMPGQMQEAVIEARAQLLAEAKLKELCKQLNIPVPVIPPSPIIHPIDEALLGDKATPITPMEGHEKEKGSENIAQRQQETYLTGEGPSRRIGPVKMELEGDIKPKQLLSTQYLPDTMLQAMEGQVDDELEVIHIKRGRDPFYDLTKGDEDLKEACALITEDLLPSHEDDVHIDDLSVASCDTYGEVDVEEAKSLLVKLAESKAKEAEILRDLAVVVSAEDLTPRQIGGIAKEVVQQEMIWPEIKYITDEYDYQATRMILAAGHCMRQIYDHNMGKAVQIMSVEKLAAKYSVNMTRLFEMLKGIKYGRENRTSRKPTLVLDIDTEADAAVGKVDEAVKKVRKTGKATEAKKGKKSKTTLQEASVPSVVEATATKASPVSESTPPE